MKHGFLKVIIMLIAISLLMALTGCGTKLKVIVSLVSQDFLNSRSGQEIFVETETVIKGSSRSELYLRAVNTMKEGKLPEVEGVATAFKKEFKVNNVTESEGIATVDFSSRNLSGDELAERLLISQIVNTLVKSFEEIESVVFTVDGEIAETLMGYVDITQSFSGPLL